MKRSDFSIESKIVDRDFNELIGRVGGKNAGTILLEMLAEEYYKLEVPPSIKLDVANVNNMKNDQAFLLNFLENLKRQNLKWHLRSSTTIEDWRDDAYYGVFRSEAVEFRKDQDINSQYRRADYILEAIFEDFDSKLQDDSYKLETEQLGLLAMQTRKGSHHLTIYSSYPEKDSKTAIIEIATQNYGFSEQPQPSHLVKIDPESIEIIYARNRDMSSVPFQYQNPYEIKGKRIPLHERTLREIYDLSQTIQDRLEKPVNFEAVTDIHEGHHSQRLHYVQLRPVPRLDPARKVQELHELDENYVLIGTTPFVTGSFREEAPLVLKHKGSGRQAYHYETPVLLVDDNESIKGHRSYLKGSNVRGLVCVNSGIALSHNYHILPSFSDRDLFHCIGAPHLSRDLDEILFPTFLKGSHKNDSARVTKFPIIIESDGREGRIYINKKDEKEFQSKATQEQRSNTRHYISNFNLDDII